MEAYEIWQSTLLECQKNGFRVLPLDAPVTEDELTALADEKPPLPVVTFARLWKEHPTDHWRTLIESAAIENPAVLDEPTSSGILAPLRSVVSRAEYAAVVWGHPLSWKSPQQWAYLLQIRAKSQDGEPAHILLHPPASRDDIEKAEAVLDMRLPPSYKRFLLVTNGLGFGADELTFVCGAGPARADWNKVVLNLWLECSHQHEICSCWREFQGVYAYERIMDREGGIDTFLSDETILVSFSRTFDDWCFDRTQPGPDGEYPVMLWDHELREAKETYLDFIAWFAGDSYLFGEG